MVHLSSEHRDWERLIGSDGANGSFEMNSFLQFFQRKQAPEAHREKKPDLGRFAWPPRVTSNSSGCGQSTSSTREAGQKGLLF